MVITNNTPSFKINDTAAVPIRPKSTVLGAAALLAADVAGKLSPGTGCVSIP